MKKNLITIAAIVALSLTACHSQQPPSPPVATCPTATVGGSTYTEVNAPANTGVAASITSTSYQFTPPSTGTWCAIVQAWALPTGASIYQASGPSNVVQVTTTATDPAISYSWTEGTNTGYGPVTYILSYAPATTVAVPLAPAVSTPTAVVSLDKPGPEMALLVPAPVLSGKAAKR
jgi:hypothetical protein